MDDSIPLIEPVVGEAELANVEDVIGSGYMTQGPYADEFAQGFAAHVDAAHALVTTSCTTGLELALDALGVGTGDEVVVPDFTHPATGNAVVRVGAEPVLADVDPRTYNVDDESMAAAVTERTAALLPVSWGGYPLDPEPIRAVAEEHDLAVVEDAACGAGASFDGTPVGSQFDVSVFSFHPRKVLTTGEGGVVTTDDAALADEMRRIKNFGVDADAGEFVRADATNFRLSDILAAVGVAQLDRASDIVERRRELAARYTELLSSVPDVRPPASPDNGRHVYQSYCVEIEAGDASTRDALIETLAEEGIETQIGTYALHCTPAFADATRAGSLSTSARLHDRLLTLPVAHSMTATDQRRVVDALDAALDAYR
jgi:dTDP-4-amino-4,6-dideoxygalactose transaminase